MSENKRIKVYIPRLGYSISFDEKRINAIIHNCFVSWDIDLTIMSIYNDIALFDVILPEDVVHIICQIESDKIKVKASEIDFWVSRGVELYENFWKAIKFARKCPDYFKTVLSAFTE